MFPIDVINEISQYCDNKSVASFLAINKEMWGKRGEVYFHETVKISRVKTPLFDRIKRVIVSDIAQVKSLKNVTHLFFDRDFNRPIDKGDIPNSVTHLTFGSAFNKCITSDNIPNSVTHLTFGERFNRSIAGVIPSSVIHLVFGTWFNQPISREIIPKSVRLLSLSKFYCFERSIPDDMNDIVFLRNVPGTVNMTRLSNIQIVN